MKRITKIEPDIKRTFTELLADAEDVTFKVLSWWKFVGEDNFADNSYWTKIN